MKNQAQDLFTTVGARIAKKLGLKEPPQVSVTTSRLVRYRKSDAEPVLDPPSNAVDRPEEFCFLAQVPLNALRAGYTQLAADRDTSVAVESYVLLPQVLLGGVPMLAGYKWVATGKLKDGRTFAAVLDLWIRELFRGCGMATLLKEHEVALAKDKGCTFIHTWHVADGPHFLSAIAPSLKNGFTLYHGTNRGGEEYEESGFIHLRKFLDAASATDVTVSFQDGTTLKSPSGDAAILKHLQTFADKPGEQIATVERHPA